jgi:DNA-binding GntR family transcriptional regulator
MISPVVTPSRRSPPELAVPLAESPSLHAQVHERIRGAILDGSLPAGSSLSPAVLAKQMGASTMPVREALRLLQEEGLVEISARRWTRVTVPDASLAVEIYPLVGMLEAMAVRDSPPYSRRRLARLRAANRELARAGRAGDVQRAINADTDFHATLVEEMRNGTLRRIIDELKGKLRLLEGVFFRTERTNVSVGQHDEIVAALRDGDVEAAAAATQRNWEYSLEALRETLAVRDDAPRAMER